MGLPWYRVHMVVLNDLGRLFSVHNAYSSSCWLGRFNGPIRISSFLSL